MKSSAERKPIILLLHDSKESDLARDVEDFLQALNFEVKLIMFEADRGKSLEGKEHYYYDNADIALFLVTPGSIRDGKNYPSPSVTAEIAIAKEKFKDIPERVIFLTEQGCNHATIDQITRTEFNRSNMRSVTQALTKVIKGLKAIKSVNSDFTLVTVENKKKAEKKRVIEVVRAYEDFQSWMREKKKEIVNKFEYALNDFSSRGMYHSSGYLNIQRENVKNFQDELEDEWRKLERVLEDYLHNFGLDTLEEDGNFSGSQKEVIKNTKEQKEELNKFIVNCFKDSTQSVFSHT